jgi:hypothetical protein
MLAEGRDLLAVIRFEKLLSQARERLAERVIAGVKLRPEDLAAAEAEATATLKQEFFNAKARQAIKSGSARMSDDEDFAARGQRLMEQAVLLSHRGLLAVPLVGDPSLSADERIG